LGYGDPTPVGVPGNGALTWIAPVGSTVQRGEPLFKIGVDSTRGVNLTFSAAGRLAEIAVAVGAQGTTGQVLARLSTEALEVKLEQARSQLASAQMKLGDVQAGPSAADLRSAQAALIQAQASYAETQAKLTTLESGATAADRASAEAAV